MARLLTLVVIGIALVSTLVEAKSIRIHVTAKILKTTVISGPGEPRSATRPSPLSCCSTSIIRKWALAREFCTLVSLEPPLGALVQCLITAVFDNKGQIIFGGIVPPPDIEAVGHFGILGGTDDFRTPAAK